VVLVGAGACLLLSVLLGSGLVLLELTARIPGLVVPGALGEPLLLPGLRVVPLGGQGWVVMLCEDFAAVLLMCGVLLRLRRHLRLRPAGGRFRRLLAGWSGLILGGAVSGLFRGMVTARQVEAGWLGWLGYPLTAALLGVLWGLLLGWLVGLAVALAQPRRVRAAGGRTRAPHVNEPAPAAT
jgi:hypothetical protein